MACGPEVMVISMVPVAMGSDAVMLLLMVVVHTVSEIMAEVAMVVAVFDLEVPALSPMMTGAALVAKVNAGSVVAVVVVLVVFVDRCCVLSTNCGLRFSSSLLLGLFLLLLLLVVVALAFPGSFVLLLLFLFDDMVSTATSCSFITSSHSFSH